MDRRPGGLLSPVRRYHYAFGSPPPRPRRPKPKWKIVSLLDNEGRPPAHSDLPFDFRYTYTELEDKARPIGFTRPSFSPFGPKHLDRPWTGLLAPVVDPTLPADGEARERALEERRKAHRARVCGEPLTPAEKALLVEKFRRPRIFNKINLGRDGLTHNTLKVIHDRWQHADAVRIYCQGVPTVDMQNICTQLEEKTGGLIIYRRDGQILLHRGRHYEPGKRPFIPLMFWKPPKPIFPALIKRKIDGLSCEETGAIRLKGLSVPALTKLAKNDYYGNLVTMVRNAFLTNEVIRIDCKVVPMNDYRKIGVKLRNLVPCVLVSFDDKQIIIWRGRRRASCDKNTDRASCLAVEPDAATSSSGDTATKIMNHMFSEL